MKKLIITIALICAPAVAAAGDFTMVLGGDGHKVIVTMDDRGDTHLSNAFRAGDRSWNVVDDEGNLSTVYDYSRGNEDRRRGEDD